MTRDTISWFIYRRVYYEYGFSCTSPVLQKGVKQFKNGMAEYHLKLHFVHIMCEQREGWAWILEISLWRDHSLIIDFSDQFPYVVDFIYIDIYLFKVLYFEVLVLKITWRNPSIARHLFNNRSQHLCSAYFHWILYYMINIGWAWEQGDNCMILKYNRCYGNDDYDDDASFQVNC